MSDVLMIMDRCAFALGHAVVQSLWQCALVGALAAAVQIGIRRPAVRYAVWCAALGLCVGWFAVTLGSGLRFDRGPAGAAELSVLGNGAVPVGAAADVGPGISGVRGLGLFESIAAIWALGFVYVGLRLMRQYGSAVRLRTRGVTEAGGVWAGLYADVRASLGVSSRVRLLVSDVARSPMVVGWLTPTVVVPASVLTMMSPEQVRLVLAHELAHIRRYDHVVNMLQVLVETVMFYHPVVWWMSRQARVEREHCCDDVAVRWGGDAVSYARALTDLEEVRVRSRAVLAMNARSHGGSLMKRVRRLFDGSDARRGSGSMRALAVLTVAAVISGAAYAHSVWNAETPREETVAAVRAGVESGVMTHDQARRVFQEVIYPGSDLERLFDRERALIRDELRDSGMSEADAKKKLEAVERSIDTRIELAFRMRVLGMEEHEAELSMFQERLERLVQSGWLTREDADGMYRARMDSMSRVPVEDEVDRALKDRKSAVEVAHAVLRALEAQIAEVELSMQDGSVEAEYGASLLSALRQKHAESLQKRHEAEGALKAILEEYGAERGAKLEVELVPVLKDAPVILTHQLRQLDVDKETLILRGVDEAALRGRLENEQGSLSYYERNIRDAFLETVRQMKMNGELTEQEAALRIEADARRQRFQSRWLSIGVMYQKEVEGGRLTVDEANAHLERALKENGYFESEFAETDPMRGMRVVEPHNVIELSVTPLAADAGEAKIRRYEVVAGDTLRGISQKVFGTPDRAGEIADLNEIKAGLLRVGMELVLPEAMVPGAEPVELEIKVEPVEKERKLTPMDEAFWHHQGVRSLSEYEEEIPEDC